MNKLTDDEIQQIKDEAEKLYPYHFDEWEREYVYEQWERKAYIAALTSERQKVKGLLDGINGVLDSWKNRMPTEDEEKKHNKEHDFYYWSPVASMVDSEAIHNLKKAIDNYNKALKQ